MVSWTYEILDPEGLHARPASKLVMAARKYKSDIRILYRQNRADAKNILSIMALCVGNGSNITIEAAGEDEDEALEAVKKALVEAYDLNPDNGRK